MSNFVHTSCTLIVSATALWLPRRRHRLYKIYGCGVVFLTLACLPLPTTACRILLAAVAPAEPLLRPMDKALRLSLLVLGRLLPPSLSSSKSRWRSGHWQVISRSRRYRRVRRRRSTNARSLGGGGCPTNRYNRYNRLWSCHSWRAFRDSFNWSIKSLLS